MKIFVGVTDSEWYRQLKVAAVDEVNFWNPGGSTFRVLQENEMFLFKLHYPDNYIVGGGFFVRFALLPPFLAWQAFGEKNGTLNYDELISRIEKYRLKHDMNGSGQIGCTILTEPFWFDEKDWISVPEWSKSIVRGKAYDTDTEAGKYLYDEVQKRISRNSLNMGNRYTESMTKHRIGQGAFRVLVTDAYQRKCAITGEKTLPVLEAAHIKPYSENGPNTISNGLLLKSDFHALFDSGYITLTKDYRIEVSRRLNEDYGNGKEYYKYHGNKILVLPQDMTLLPKKEFVEWHNEHVYLG